MVIKANQPGPAARMNYGTVQPQLTCPSRNDLNPVGSSTITFECSSNPSYADPKHNQLGKTVISYQSNPFRQALGFQEDIDKETLQAIHLSCVIDDLLDCPKGNSPESLSSNDSLPSLCSDSEDAPPPPPPAPAPAPPPPPPGQSLDNVLVHPFNELTDYGLKPIMLKTNDSTKTAAKDVALRITPYSAFIVYRPKAEFLAKYIIDLNSPKVQRYCKRMVPENLPSRLCQEIIFDSWVEDKPCEPGEPDEPGEITCNSDSGSASPELKSIRLPKIVDDELERVLEAFVHSIENEEYMEITFGSSSKGPTEIEIRSRVQYLFDLIQHIREYLIKQHSYNSETVNHAAMIKKFRSEISLHPKKMDHFYKKPEKKMWKAFRILSVILADYIEDYIELIDQLDYKFLQLAGRQPFDHKLYANFKHRSQAMVVILAREAPSIGQLTKCIDALARLILTRQSVKSHIAIAKSLA